MVQFSNNIMNSWLSIALLVLYSCYEKNTLLLFENNLQVKHSHVKNLIENRHLHHSNHKITFEKKIRTFNFSNKNCFIFSSLNHFTIWYPQQMAIIIIIIKHISILLHFIDFNNLNPFFYNFSFLFIQVWFMFWMR